MNKMRLLVLTMWAGLFSVGAFMFDLPNAHAAFVDEIWITGKVTSEFNKESIELDTESGKVKVPRNSITEEQENKLAVGLNLTVKVKMLDVLKFNGIPLQVLRAERQPASQCGAGGTSCGK